MKDRKDILLRAAFDLLQRADQGPYVQEAGSIHVRYDEADCDGFCLKEDIAVELGISGDENPIELKEDDQ